jgi:hypothetical protein
VKLGRTRVSHQRALVLLAHSSTRVKLFLNARTLEPIAVEFRGRRYRGWSFVLAIRLARPYARGPPRV